MEKLAEHVLLISLHWAPEQSLFLSWWSDTPLCMGKAAANAVHALPLMGNWLKENQTTLFSGFFVSSLIAGTWRGKGPMSGLGTDDEVKM